MLRTSTPTLTRRTPLFSKGTMRGGVPRIYYGWMKPGSFTRRRFEKLRNPFVDLETGTSLYYRNGQEPADAMAHEADAYGLKGMDTASDLFSEHRIVPDLYPEGFQWKHKLNTEYNQFRSNTWLTPDLIPSEHRGRFLCNFQLHVAQYTMRVARFAPKDHRQWIYALVYVGSGKGLAGYGRAIAPSTGEAKQEAIRDAFTNMMAIDLEQGGIMYPVRINSDGCRVMIYPAKKISATFILADVLCAFGIQHCGVKINTSQQNKPRSATHQYIGLFNALKAYRSVNEIAASRGKVPHSLIYNIYPFLEEMRRRKGMMAMHPAGKDGMFAPDRVVDNRLPDHLKKGYYNDTYWKDFFAGDEKLLNEPKMGLRGDQLRAISPPPVRKAGQRKSLSDVLSRLNKTVADLGSITVGNANLDRPIHSHVKRTFPLH